MQQYWSVARTHVGREAFSAEQLAARGYEIFLPKLETRRTVEPLFKGYVFLLIVDGHFLAANTCFGVVSLIKAGERPARVPDAEIQSLKNRLNDRGVIRLDPPPRPPPRAFAKGEKVKIIVGGSRFDAIHTGLSRRQRELVLISVLGGRREIAVSSHLVEARP